MEDLEILHAAVATGEANLAKVREIIRQLRREREDTLRARIVFRIFAVALLEHRRLLEALVARSPPGAIGSVPLQPNRRPAADFRTRLPPTRRRAQRVSVPIYVSR